MLNLFNVPPSTIVYRWGLLLHSIERLYGFSNKSGVTRDDHAVVDVWGWLRGLGELHPPSVYRQT
jgi:hypothetical protein